VSLGTFCLVLHSHLPWVANHGRWPVGEEWLHQAWGHAYVPLVEVLRGLANEGRTDLLTLGVTPILAAQLDDPSCIAAQRTWLADWQVRAAGSAAARDPLQQRTGQREFGHATATMDAFDAHWRGGGSPALRELRDGGVIELLGGPATHPFLPLLDSRVRDFALAVGLDDFVIRLGSRPAGMWIPECGYRPGLETALDAAGVQHTVVDGPTFGQLGTNAPVRLGDSDVVAFGRNLDITYRVWSPRRGYPGNRWYRDFHTFDHTWGLRPARVTSVSTTPDDKAPYDPQRAAEQVQADAADFIDRVREHCIAHPGAVVVAAYDTELFGHWWHEGPAFLDAILRGLPAAGIEVSTLERVRDRADTAAHLPAGSWGSGKDWRVWDGELVSDIAEANQRLQASVLDALADQPRGYRSFARDQIARELLLALASDWPFMVTKDSAAQYARERHSGHCANVRTLLRDPSADVADALRKINGPFGHLDARLLSGERH
jgi:1,4-alpha-glucan branching enzyme